MKSMKLVNIFGTKKINKEVQEYIDVYILKN